MSRRGGRARTPPARLHGLELCYDGNEVNVQLLLQLAKEALEQVSSGACLCGSPTTTSLRSLFT
jgi:hypothetical protein